MRPGNGITRLRAGATGLVLLLGLGLATPAVAKDGSGDARARGTCSRSSDWELRAKTADGRLEVRFEIDSNRGGQQWIYTIRHDGIVTASGRRATSSSGGSFRVERARTDAPGTTTITATARNAKTREYCRSAVRL
jgi:hypothetical protein